MSNVFFTSDAHLGHRNIQTYRDSVTSCEDNERQFVQEWEAKISKRTARHKQDIIWCLGDMAFDERSHNIMAQLPGRKFLALGNHDYLYPRALASTYEKIFGIISHYGHWVSHAPIHPAELYNRINIHGHVHEKTIISPNYINVSVDALTLNFGCMIIDLKQLHEYIAMAARGEVKVAPFKNYSFGKQEK